MNVAHALIHTWEKIGIKYAFGIPGEETLELVEALRNSNIEFIITRHDLHTDDRFQGSAH